MIQMSVFTVQQILLNILQHFLYPLQRMFFNFFLIRQSWKMCQILLNFILFISSYLCLDLIFFKKEKKPNIFLKASRSFSIHFTKALQLPFEQQLDKSHLRIQNVLREHFRCTLKKKASFHEKQQMRAEEKYVTT